MKKFYPSTLSLTKEEATVRIFEYFDKGEIPIIVDTIKKQFQIPLYETQKVREIIGDLLSERDRLDTIEFLNFCMQEVANKKFEKWLSTPVHVVPFDPQIHG
ncbi:hypothetical protein PVA17_20245 [Lysinibacillus sp. CNPSo 3705]|uniref:hypothetical protein n=1 Tax=Lysinibacillus sp. CNPSo 3705 TaxID=3028148 RepID=UPI0023633476|nr:hypothetical protein [Lysinibacillus sp. CNPSo 3705]MDD1505076.1 hypothetical protein [Lysinibacillus sp. CNPSo 3705]